MIRTNYRVQEKDLPPPGVPNDRNCRGRHAPRDLDLALPQREGRYKPPFLLEVKPRQSAVVFLRHACGTEHVIFQLSLRVPKIEDKEGDKEVPLVPALQLI